MATGAYALGRLFDIQSVIHVDDLCNGAETGMRVPLINAEGVTFVIFCAAGNGTTDDLAVDLQEHDAATGGTSQDLDIITDYYKKEEATLDNDETWTKVSQTAASEITAVAGSQEKENLYIVEVRADQLSAGFEYVSINTPDLGNTDAKYGGVVAILWGLKHPRTPANIPSPL